MIQNERHLKSQCLKTGFVGCCVLALLSLISKNIAFINGYVLGVCIAYSILLLDCSIVDGILQMKNNRPYMFMGIFFLIKLGMYAIGFYIAVKIPVIFNLVSVFIGYLNTKLTFYRLTLTRR